MSRKADAVLVSIDILCTALQQHYACLAVWLWVFFQIIFCAKIHVNDIFLFFKNYFWHQHIKTIQNIQTILNFSKKKSNFLRKRALYRCYSLVSIINSLIQKLPKDRFEPLLQNVKELCVQNDVYVPYLKAQYTRSRDN